MKLFKNFSDRIWLLLLGATGITFWLGEREAAPVLGMPAVLLMFALAGLKGWLVIDDFMGLRQAPRLWRWLLLGWLGVVCALVVLAYAIGLGC